MKKFVLLFLALSSLTFAAASITLGDNNPFTTTPSVSTAGINVNVSAIVTTSDVTQLTIVDENGKQISDVNFYHILTQSGDNTLGGETELTQSIYAKAPGLTEAGKGKLTKSKLDIFTGTNDPNFSSTIDVKQESFDTNLKGVKYTLTSIAAANGQQLIKDAVISTTSQPLIFTYDKTK